jgi:signal transduction histidine kinase
MTLCCALLSSALALISAVHTEQWFETRGVEQFEQARAIHELEMAMLNAAYPHGDKTKPKADLREDASATYRRVVEQCQALSRANNRDIEVAVQARRMNSGAAIFMVVALVCAMGISRLFFTEVFQPLRRILKDAKPYSALDHQAASHNEIRSLKMYLDTLRSDASQARSTLDQTRRHLLDSEKFAAVGRVAAGVAHEIRSPLTSLKLRLFSLQKVLGDNPSHTANVSVMFDEITRLDNIIRNFLEFSRPPALKIKPCSLSLVLDKTLELLQYKFDVKQIAVHRTERPRLPSVLADPQQLMQVFINLLNNAIDALPDRGTIRIAAAIEFMDAQPMIVARIGDSGPAIPADLKEQIFDPFFSTKKDGAGLGLWISQRIMQEHGGRLELESSTAEETVFAAWIPVAERQR